MNNDQSRQVLSEMLAAQEAGEPVVLATVIRARGSVPRQSGAKMLVYGDGRISGTIGGGEMESRVIQEAQAALADGQTRIVPYALVDPKRGDPGVCGGEVDVYLEPYSPPATVLVIGCGHVGKAVASLAHWLDYRVIVTDDREELASPENIPEANIYLPGEIDDVLEQLSIHENTHIVLLTRNVMLDRQILPRLANSPASYIGVIGSRRRWQETRKLLLDDGISEADLQRYHSPVGLELNAETPEEIAVSIMAEIIMLRQGGTGDRMGEQGN
ncbi:MAG: XdhC family protein [Candidatus Promineifilaceae bacterium]|nr:XdhC family protein [Candidatus Promineifilaceae bacterium]